MIPYTSCYFPKYTWQDSDLPNHPSCCLELLKLFFRVVQFWQSCWNCMCSLSEYSQNWHSYRYILLQTRTHIMTINQHKSAKGRTFCLCPNVSINVCWEIHSLTHCGLVLHMAQGSMSTLVEVMACCLTAPSHYLNQCWLIITKVRVQWCSYDGYFTWDVTAISH